MPNDMNARKTSLFTGENGVRYLVPFVFICSLFLLWGFAHGFLDVLDKHFQDLLHVSKAQSGFVQFSLYIGYLAMGIPAGLFIKKYGYQRGIIFGLALFAIGAFLFYPAAKLEKFIPFLLALFVLACGLAFLKPPPIRILRYWAERNRRPVASIFRNRSTDWAGYWVR